jgi:hypothetical protein
MSTVQKINFTPVSDILPIQRRDFAVADPTLTQPLNALALVDGEWMTLNSSYQILRACDVTSGTAAAAVRSFPLFAERGRSDVQSMSLHKMPLLFRGDYEFDTRIFDASATNNSGAAITTIMQPLKVATITIGSRNYVGLIGHSGLSTSLDPIVGYVTKLPANNGGQLRFISGWRS